MATDTAPSTRPSSPGLATPKRSIDLADSLPVLSYTTSQLTPPSCSETNPRTGLAQRFKQAHWRSYDYFLGFIAGFCLLVDLGVYTLYTAIIPFQLKAIGLEDQVEAMTGYISAAAAGGAIVASPFAGWIGRRFPHKRILLLANLTLLAGGVLCFMFVPSMVGMTVGRVMQGAAAAGLWTAALSLISDNVHPTRAGRVTALTMFGHSIGNTSSQTVGGSLYQALGWKAPNIYGLVLIAICAILCLFFIEKKDLPTTSVYEGSIAVNSARTSLADLEKQPSADEAKRASTTAATTPTFKQQQQALSTKSAIRTLLTNPKYLVGLLFSAYYGAYQGAVTQTALALRLESRYGLDAQRVGYSYLAIAAPAFVAVPLIGILIDRYGPRRLSLAAIGSLCIWMAIMCINALPYAAFMAILVGVGISVSLVNTPIVVYLAGVDRENGGIVGTPLLYGAWNMMYSISQLVFPILAGNVLDKAGNTRGWIIILCVLCGTGAACFTAMLRYMRLSGSSPAQP